MAFTLRIAQTRVGQAATIEFLLDWNVIGLDLSSFQSPAVAESNWA